MKPITAFYLTHCPYCRNAKAALEELITENQVYGTVPITWYEESENPDAVKGHTYYYVPSLFIGHEKLYEAQPGQTYEEIKKHVKAALDKALAM
jgi:glutaredoxin